MAHSWETWSGWSKTPAPSQWLYELKNSGELEVYPEIFNMIGIPQDPTWHPCGDVFTHTCHVLDAAAEIAKREKLDDKTRELLIFSALAHDFGKVRATFLKNGRWTSPNHGMLGIGDAKKFLDRIGNSCIEGSYLNEKLKKLVIEHLSYVNIETDKSIFHLADRLKPASIEELLWLIEADVSGRPPLPKGLPERAKKLKTRALELGVYHRGPDPLISNDLLVSHGFQNQGESFIKQAYVSQLSGIFHTEKEALAWVRSQIFRPLLNGRLIIDNGILPPSNKVGKLLDAAKLAQCRGEFLNLDDALTWAKWWVANN